MKKKLSTLITLFGLAMIATLSARAQTLTVLYNFNVGPTGYDPVSKLLRVGNDLYGTTTIGGADPTAGTVFKLSSKGIETVLHSFTGSPDGYTPMAGLIGDGSGNFYGTTVNGGNNNSISDLGTIFKVTKTGEESVFYRFNGYPTDGSNPNPTLMRDAAGNLYGTTSTGGSGRCQDQQSDVVGCGTVFKLDTQGVETILHSFADGVQDGQQPLAGLVFDTAGNLYGTTYWGGAAGLGTVFKVTPDGTETVLYNFTGIPDGANPQGGVIWHSGVLYGTTYQGGTANFGTVFKLTKSGHETVLHSFTGKQRDGEYPTTALIRDSAGNLYGTTEAGGGTASLKYCHVLADGCGIVFKLTGAGQETVLHSFTGYPNDGSYPLGGLIRDSAGNFYGTTFVGGSNEAGTVFKLTP